MAQRLHFTKMQGLGNDFVVLDGVREKIELEPAAIRRLADRHFGVGCDQVLLVEKPSRPDVDFRYRIFNADGAMRQRCALLRPVRPRTRIDRQAHDPRRDRWRNHRADRDGR